VRTLEKLRTESKDLREQNKAGADAMRRLAEIEDAQKSEAQRVTDKMTAAEARAAAAELKALRLEVALTKGVPADYQEFLVGDTLEELQARADKLLALGARGTEVKVETSSTRPKEALKSGATSVEVGGVIQLTRDDLKGKSAEWIEAARVAGQLNLIQGIT
jgi:hypothetical protein